MTESLRKRKRGEGEFGIQKIGDDYYKVDVESFQKKRRKIDSGIPEVESVADEKIKSCGEKIDCSVYNLGEKKFKKRRQRLTSENMIGQDKKVSMFNERIEFYKELLLRHMKFVESNKTKEEKFCCTLEVAHKHGEVEKFILKWTVFNEGKCATFSFCNSDNAVFDMNEISISTEKVFSIVVKCGLSEAQYKFIRKVFEGRIFPSWGTIKAIFEKNKISMIKLMSVVVRNGNNQDVIGFYLDIPSLLYEFLQDKDVLQDYVVRSIIGETFFIEQEKKMKEYWKNKLSERELKLSDLEKEYKEFQKNKKFQMAQAKVFNSIFCSFCFFF